ncbi:MAG: amidohydrolase, partial [Spirochaetales bacterium]|nr:amidohydrolase [Spirochaetales bacterium]
AMHSGNIESTMCDGKWLMKDRKILNLDEEAILKEGCQRAKAIYKRAGIVLPDRFPVVKC